MRFMTHIQEVSLVKNEGNKLEVGVGQRPPWIFFQDSCRNDFWRPAVTPHNYWAGPRWIQPHPSCTDAGGVA